MSDAAGTSCYMAHTGSVEGCGYGKSKLGNESYSEAAKKRAVSNGRFSPSPADRTGSMSSLNKMGSSH